MPEFYWPETPDLFPTGGPFGTRAEAVDDASATLDPGSEFFTAEKREVTAADFGESDELRTELVKAVEDWIRKHDLPTFWRAVEIERHELPGRGDS